MIDSSPFDYYENINILPFTSLLGWGESNSIHTGGPVWPNWDANYTVRHCRKGRPVDSKPDIAFFADSEFLTLEDVAYWCGPISSHFGHMISEFISRAVQYNRCGGKFVFGAPYDSGMDTLDKTPKFFRDIVRWLNIPEEEVLIANRPVLSKKLFCAPQAEQLNYDVEPPAYYLDILKRLQESQLGQVNESGDCYYVSRAAMGAKIAGEGYLEDVLGASGVKVIRPEAISLFEQLRIYSSSSKIIFSEGSALHAMQLLGSSGAKVYILNRRPGSRIAEAALSARCSSLKYFDIGRLIHGKFMMSGRPAPHLGITYVPSREILSCFNNIGVELSGWSSSDFEFYAKNDIFSWFEGESSSPRAKILDHCK